MEYGSFDNESTKLIVISIVTRRIMMMESIVYCQVIMKKRLNQIMDESQRLKGRLVLSYE